MSDLYTQVVNSPPGRMIAGRVGPAPADAAGAPRARRAGRSPAPCSAAAPRAAGLGKRIEQVLGEVGAAKPETPSGPVKALVFDATGIADSTELVELQRFFHPNVERVQRSGRVVVLGTPPAGLPPRAATAQRALEGFTRSLGKEIGRGIAVQLVYVAEGAEEEIDSTLRFLLSPRSAYVSGQVVEVGKAVAEDARDRLGAAAGRARWRWSPAPRAESARRSRRPCTATAPSSSCSTCRRSPPI